MPPSEPESPGPKPGCLFTDRSTTFVLFSSE